MHSRDGGAELGQAGDQRVVVAVQGRLLHRDEGGNAGGGLGLDRDVDHLKPLLVLAAQKVLDDGDVVEGNLMPGGLRPIERPPVVEVVRGVGQDRRAAQAVGHFDPRHSEPGGQPIRHLPALDIGVGEEGQQRHCAFELACAVQGLRVEWRQGVDMVAHALADQQTRQVGCARVPGRKTLWKRHHRIVGGQKATVEEGKLRHAGADCSATKRVNLGG